MFLYPYIPNEKAKLFIADAHIENACVITPPALCNLPKALQRHADLGICIISEKKAVCPPETYIYYKSALAPYGFEIIEGKSHIGCNYPEDSAYNVGIVGKKCFLNKRVCDKVLYDILIGAHYEIIEVKQGYTKCSISPVTHNSFITGDRAICEAGRRNGLDVLLVSNEGIKLGGYSNGFWGGCCGLMAEDELLVNGELMTLPSGKAIKEFLDKKNVKVTEIKKGEVTDIGSIIPLL